MFIKIIIEIVTILILAINSMHPAPPVAKAVPPVVRETPRPTPKPTPKPVIKIVPKQTFKRVVTGRATWYNVGRGYYAAAGPKLRVGNYIGRVVQVCSSNRCIRVKLITSCACFKGDPRERIIDLSSDAFAALYPLSKGIGTVTVKW